MYFLIEYDRSKGDISSIGEFEDTAVSEAENARLDKELELHRRGLEREVVLLQAASLDALRETHRRYFEDLADMLAAPEPSR